MHAEGVTAGAFEIEVLGAIRRYVLLQARGVDPDTVPTLIDLHGSGSWPEEHVAVAGARSFAAAGAVVVVPQAGIPFQLLAEWPTGWAWSVPGSPLPDESIPRDEPDDLAFMDALTTRLVEQHGVNPRRVHVRGFSGGARLASHLISAMGNRLSSVCCVGGIRFVPSAGVLPPLLAIHGGLDTFNPYEGGIGPRWSESVESVVYQWAVASGCRPTPQYFPLSDDVRETQYMDARGFAAVRLITIVNGMHSWPGTLHGDHIEQFGAPGSFSASQAHWDFIRDVDQSRRPG
jgi:polyhydroxybutyrate depolymerase